MHTVLWKRQDLPGHEVCRVLQRNTGWEVVGVAVLAYEQQACRLDYAIDCDPYWVTQAAVVTGWRTFSILDSTGQMAFLGHLVCGCRYRRLGTRWAGSRM
jgi:hypothetical protein